MNGALRRDAETIVRRAIRQVLPEEAVRKALRGKTFPGKILVIAVGKAAWPMAKSAMECIRVDGGLVISKYGHIPGPIAPLRTIEAGHPIPDENSVRAAEEAMAMVRGLTASDTVVFLLSGGGSALFEKPLVPLAEYQAISEQLLRSGADIVEINTVRKRLSAVKGGKFAALCAPARVVSVILSDIVGDPVDMIASGPTCEDRSSCAEALSVAAKYGLSLSSGALACLRTETPKGLTNTEHHVTGSVKALCAAAMRECSLLGYAPVLLTDELCCEAREAGEMLAAELMRYLHGGGRVALLAGGETVVHVTGDGLGGRNQELALAAAPGLAGIDGAAVISVGSDGTDGPTDAAGGYADGDTAAALACMGISIPETLKRNDSYHALQAVEGLIFTGPTLTNVNDIAVALLRAE